MGWPVGSLRRRRLANCRCWCRTVEGGRRCFCARSLIHYFQLFSLPVFQFPLALRAGDLRSVAPRWIPQKKKKRRKKTSHVRVFSFYFSKQRKGRLRSGFTHQSADGFKLFTGTRQLKHHTVKATFTRLLQVSRHQCLTAYKPPRA